MQNVPGIASLTVLCALCIAAPSWWATGSVPSPFEVRPGAIRQLVDLSDAYPVRVCIDADVRAAATVSHDGNEDPLNQGDCMMVRARTVAVRAAVDMPKGTLVTGSYAVQ